jgi:hypothetical protein
MGWAIAAHSIFKPELASAIAVGVEGDRDQTINLNKALLYGYMAFMSVGSGGRDYDDCCSSQYPLCTSD